MERSRIKGSNIPLRGNMETLSDNTDKTKYKEVTAMLKFLNKISYKELILYQEDMVCFQIVE